MLPKTPTIITLGELKVLAFSNIFYQSPLCLNLEFTGVSWVIHGLTLLAVPDKYIMLDITIDMDVESQPGPETDTSLGGVNKNYPTLIRTKPASSL